MRNTDTDTDTDTGVGLLLAAAVLFVVALLGEGCAAVPTPAETWCGAAERCGVLTEGTYEQIPWTYDSCVDRFSAPAQYLTGACLGEVDTAAICPFFLTGRVSTLPEECKDHASY